MALGVVLVGATIAYAVASVPLPGELDTEPTTVLDRDGDEIGQLSAEASREDVALDDVPVGDYTIPFGQAAIKRRGKDATVVATSLTVGVAMLAAVLLSVPVAWVYLLTRAKRGYQQSVVQLLIVLPTVVAGIRCGALQRPIWSE